MPDEAAVYFEHAKATKSTVKYKEFTDLTFLEQLQKIKAKGVLGIFEPYEVDRWKEQLKATSFTRTNYLTPNIGTVEYLRLVRPVGVNF